MYVAVYADATGLFSERMLDLMNDNVLYIDVPKKILKQFFEEKCKECYTENDYDESKDSFDNWYEDIYTCDDTYDLWCYLEYHGYVPSIDINIEMKRPND